MRAVLVVLILRAVQLRERVKVLCRVVLRHILNVLSWVLVHILSHLVHLLILMDLTVILGLIDLTHLLRNLLIHPSWTHLVRLSHLLV